MKTEIITKAHAYQLLEQAGQKPVLPYRGYATAISSTSRIAIQPDGQIALITDDKQQGQAFKPNSWE